MPTDRAHAAEDEYFRNAEAERRREDAWQLQKTARAERAGREAVAARRRRQAARSAGAVPDALRGARGWLDRLIARGLAWARSFRRFP
jgi:hypothetical protein